MAQKPRVLVVEDDAEIGGALRRSLRLEGYDVRLAEDGVAALEESALFEPDAVVLDLGLPRLDGIEVCRRLRDTSDVPILMLTARDSLDSRVEGLDTGADDYLVKPFERQELLARLRALLRRRPPRGSAFLVVGDLRLNPDTREVLRGDRPLDLTSREFELLEYLMRNERLVVTREALLEQVWGYQVLVETNTVDVFISNLRRKLEAGGEPRVLHTVRGSRVRAARAMRRLAQSFDRLPVRWRLSVTSAGLTFVILLLFAVAAEMVTVSRVRSDFDSSLRLTATQLQSRVAPSGYSNDRGITFNRESSTPPPRGAVIRIVDGYGAPILYTADIDFGPPRGGVHETAGYRMVTVPISSDGAPIAYLQYAKPVSSLDDRSAASASSSSSVSWPAPRWPCSPASWSPAARCPRWRASPAPPRRSPARATRA